MATMYAILTRHERHTNNVCPPEAIQHAEETGDRLGSYLEDEEIDVPRYRVDSPQPRAQQTGDAQTHGMCNEDLIVSVLDLRLGDITNGRALTPDEVTAAKTYAAEKKISIEQALVACPSIAGAMTERGEEAAVAFTEHMLAAAKAGIETVAIFSHGGRLEPMISCLQGTSLAKPAFMFETGTVAVATCEVDVESGSVQIAEVNYLGDLSPMYSVEDDRF